MPTHLMLMRHAKSSWKDDTLTDHERPLNKRGKREADIVAQTLVAKRLAPDVIWASDAARTQETAKRLIRIIPGAQTIIKVPEFYHASADSVMQFCARQEPPAGRLMLLGHNPGWTELVEHLFGLHVDMPTACCRIFKPSASKEGTSWISPYKWRHIDVLKAKELLADRDDCEAGSE